jgi:hypothetical protein
VLQCRTLLLDEADIVAVLQASKMTSEEVTLALQVAETTEVKIDAAREGYGPSPRAPRCSTSCSTTSRP